MNVRLVFNDLLSFDVAEHHERIHGPFDSILWLLLSLQKNKITLIIRRQFSSEHGERKK